jgi:hypothetical protein
MVERRAWDIQKYLLIAWLGILVYVECGDSSAFKQESADVFVSEVSTDPIEKTADKWHGNGLSWAGGTRLYIYGQGFSTNGNNVVLMENEVCTGNEQYYCRRLAVPCRVIGEWSTTSIPWHLPLCQTTPYHNTQQHISAHHNMYVTLHFLSNIHISI